MPDAVLPVRVNGAKWHSLVRRTRKRGLRLLRDRRVQGGLIALCLSLLFFFSLSRLLHSSSQSVDSRSTLTASLRDKDGWIRAPKVFIAIGSAPHNFDLRNTARKSWLKWRSSSDQVTYRFFSDRPPPSEELKLDADAQAKWLKLQKEADRRKDIVLQSLPTGYGDKEHNAYSRRALYQMKWALETEDDFDFFLRVDDDSFLCLHKLIYELSSLPTTQFFWGRFWCREGRNRADENFMLFSRDVVELLGDKSLVGKVIPFDEEVTLGWNIGYWSWVLNLTIFDDQERIDAQQGYLTDYMHNETVADKDKLQQFCGTYIYAHHVRPSVMKAAYEATKLHLMYPLPVRLSPMETCPRSSQSFVPARHSTLLPDLRIGRSVNAPT